MTRSPRRRTRLALLAGAAAVSVVLAACGSSDSDAANEAGSVRLQASWVNDAEFSGYFTALDKGYYEDAGVDVTYLPGGPNVIPESTLVAGKADIALSSPDTTLNAITKQGADLVIVGAQYQRNPLGVVSLASSGIQEPADLVGKTVAVPDVNKLAFEALLTINHVDPDDVKVVPYAYDPTPLIKGEVDATVDFTTNVPFTIEQSGKKASSFLLHDYGYKIPNDTVVVTRETLEKRRGDVVAFLEASRRGWTENLKDPKAYPATFMKTWFKGNGRTLANEQYFNTAQKPLVESAAGPMALSPETVSETIATLKLIGIDADEKMFDTTLLDAR